ncbi:MAG: DUF1949 domain-containing protein, partial [Longimicrobiales bacterium]|nr:DUF1949 domain-containing protein [Longimicrobiales bacterium]
PEVDAVQRLIQEDELPVLAEEFGARVRYRLAVPVAEVDDLEARIADITRGGGSLRRVDEG